MKRILVFGDSNVFGYVPGKGTRYPDDVRWTNVLQKTLGEEYTIIENGISGRTTVFNHEWNPYLNGKEGLGYAIQANYPLDAVVILLGINDIIDHSAKLCMKGMDEIIRIAKNASNYYRVECPVYVNEPKILLIAPAIHPNFKEVAVSPYNENASVAMKLASLYKEIASDRHIEFLDARDTEVSDIDGLHLTEKGHKDLGEAVAIKLREMF